MKIINLFLTLIVIPFIMSCDKEAAIEGKDFPFVITKEVTAITDSSVVFNGEIIGIGYDVTTEYGFLWDTDDPKFETANKVAIYTQGKAGTYQIKVDSNLFKDTKQLVKAYLKTNRTIAYGNPVSFTCNGGLSSKINSIYPLKGYAGSEVVIQGSNFTNQKDNITVLFGEHKAEIKSCSKNQIVVTVPDFEADSEVMLKISVYNKEVIADTKFKVFTYWKKIADFPGKQRYGAVSFSVGNEGYVGLGHEYDGKFFNDFYRYNPQKNTWNKIANFPGDTRKYALGFSYNGKGYIGFGYANNHYYDDIWMYNPTTDKWRKVAEYLNIRTYEDAYFMIDNKLIIVAQTGVYELDLETMNFSYIGFFKGQYRSYTTGFSIKDKGYLFSGQTNGNEYMKDLWEYDSKTNIWKKLSELAGSNYRDSPVSFSLTGRLFMGLGRFMDLYRDFYEYDIINKKWITLQNFPGQGRIHSTSFTIGNKAYIGTGFDNYIYQFSDFYEFDPDKE